MTAWATVEVAVQAMRHGANDFLEKPWNNQRLLIGAAQPGAARRGAPARPAARGRERDPARERRHRPDRDLAADAGGRAARAAGRALGCERADHRRAGHRQEPAREADPRLVGPRGEVLHRRQCRRPAGVRVRERDVRPREGRLHRRQGRSRGPLRARGRRHAVPRRDRQRAAARSRRDCCARSRPASSSASARRARSAPTCAWCRRPTRTCRR